MILLVQPCRSLSENEWIEDTGHKQAHKEACHYLIQLHFIQIFERSIDDEDLQI